MDSKLRGKAEKSFPVLSAKRQNMDSKLRGKAEKSFPVLSAPFFITIRSASAEQHADYL